MHTMTSRRWVAPTAMAVAVAATSLGLLVYRDRPNYAFIGLALVACVAYLVMVVADRRWSGLRVSNVVVATVAGTAAAVAVMPRATGDLWMYAVYGRMAAHHLDPWTQLPAQLPRDGLTHIAGPRWMHTPSMYGPLMVWIERVAAPALGGSLLATRLYYQGIAVAALAATMMILWRRTRSASALAFFAINPVVLVYLVNGGRNDILVGLAMLVAAVLVTDGHDALATVIATAAVLVKFTAGIGVLALVVWLAVRRGRRPAIRAVVGSGAVLALGVALGGVASFAVPLHKAGQLYSAGSLWEILGRVHVTYPSTRLAVVVATGLALVVLARHLRGSAAFAVAATILAFSLGLPYVLPGYLGWTLAAASLEHRGRVAAVSALWSLVLVIGYAVVRNPFGGHFGADTGVWVRVVLPAAAITGLVLLLSDRDRGRRDDPAGPFVASPRPSELAADARVLAVVPTYNEAANVETVLRRVRAACPVADLLVVDDDSPDGTAAIVARVGAELGRIEVLARPARSGLGTAYCDGFRVALARGYDVVLEMDADLSHQPESMPALLDAVGGGADLAIGSRYVEGGATVDWSARRRVLSRTGGLYASWLLGLPARDVTSGFRAYRATLLRRIDLAEVRTSGYGFQIEMTYRTVAAGGRITEVPITFHERVAGTSKMSGAIVAEALGMVTRLGLARVAGAARVTRGSRREQMPVAG